MIGRAVKSTQWSGTVDVNFIPAPYDDEIDHMPVCVTRMDPSNFAFILLLEHGVRHYQLELRVQSQ